MSRRGSMQYWPHRRARRRLPRLRNGPHLREATLSNIVAYKAGMTHAVVVDDSESPQKGMEVSRGCTVLEVPRMEAYGIRLYSTDPNSKYKVAAEEVYNKALAQKLGIKETKNDESKMGSIKPRLKEFSDIALLVAAYPAGMPVEQHHPVRFESYPGGKTLDERFDYASKLLGNEIKAADIFKAGEYIDVTSVSKGKGWQGPIKRMHVKRNFHKGTGKIRHGGPLGAFSPGKIYYTTPRAGQLGFNYRTEHNKRILRVGAKADAASVAQAGGFKNYGNPSNDYIIILGSVPGTAKRLVRLRKSIRNRNASGIKEQKTVYISK